MAEGADEGVNRRGETAAGKFAERLFCGERREQRHFGNNAQRDEREVEREVGRFCWSADIMVIDSVALRRSEREYRCGTRGKLAQRVRASRVPGLLPTLMKIRLVAKVAGVVDVRE